MVAPNGAAAISPDFSRVRNPGNDETPKYPSTKE
jgi:hypothetical protein